MVSISSQAPRSSLTATTCGFDPSRLLNSVEWPGSTVFHYARQLVGHAGFTISDLDDLQQDLAVHALVHWHKFDSKRATERTFLDRILRQRKLAILRRRKSGFANLRDLSSVSDLCRDRRRNFPRDHIAAVDCQHDVGHFLAGMSSRDRELAMGLMHHSVTDLARLQGRHRQRLHEEIRRVRLRAEDDGLREYLS
jgi:RNA polymerase sigma-70 factor (ECF subfamily)